MRKLSARQRELMLIAARRAYLNVQDENALPLTDLWVGLGTGKQYRPAVRAGLMRFVKPARSVEGPRNSHWFKLTPEGAAIVQEIIDLWEVGWETTEYPYDH